MYRLENVERRKIHLPERGVDIALIDWGGDGPLALLHHANGFCAGIWGLLAEQLRPHYRVVAIDARGHGDSSSPPGAAAYDWREFVNDLIPVAETLAREQGGEPVALGMGNSFGGLVTAYAAALRPDLFARIAMLDPVIRPPEHLLAQMIQRVPGAQPGDFESRGNPLAEMARNRRQVWPSRDVAREAWAGKDMFRSWQPEALDLYVSEGMGDREDGQVELKCRGDVEAAVFETGGLDIFEVAHQITAPTLIVRAGRGHFPMVVFEAVAERIPDCRTVELDIDHLMPMHNPPELLETLLGFAKS